MRFFLSSLFLLGLISCSGGGKKTSAMIRIQQGSFPNYSGMLYGQHTVTKKRFAMKIDHTTPQVSVELPVGAWTFAMIAWDGASPLEGNARCFSQVVTLDSKPTTINAHVTVTGCSDAVFGGPATAAPGFGLKSLTFNNCSHLNGITSATNECLGFQKGLNKSFRIGLATYNEMTSTPPAEALQSACLDVISDNATATNLRIPLGTNAHLFAMFIHSYDSVGCQGASGQDFVAEGLQDSEGIVFPQASLHAYFIDHGLDDFFAVSSGGGSSSGVATKPRFKLGTTPPKYVYPDEASYGGVMVGDFGTYANPIIPSPTNTGFYYSDFQTNGPGGLLFVANDVDQNVFNFYSFAGADDSVAAQSSFTAADQAGPGMYGVSGPVYGDGSGKYVFKSVNSSDAHRICYVEPGISSACSYKEAPGVSSITTIGALNPYLFYFAVQGGDMKVFNVNHSAGSTMKLNVSTDVNTVTGIVPAMFNNKFYAYVTGTPNDLVLEIRGNGDVFSLSATPTTYSDSKTIEFNNKLWKTWSTPNGVLPTSIDIAGTLSNPNYSTFSDASPAIIAGVLNNKLLFTTDRDGAGGGTYSSALFEIDSANVASVVVGPEHVLPLNSSNHIIHNNKLFFQAFNSSNGVELWVYDGTGSAQILREINAGVADGNPSSFTPFGNKLLFTAEDSINGRELWITDGTLNGTLMLKDIVPGTAGVNIYQIAPTQNYAYFFAGPSGADQHLYRTNGTPAGTVKLFDLGAYMWNPGSVFSWEDRAHIYFNDVNTIAYHFYFKPRQN